MYATEFPVIIFSYAHALILILCILDVIHHGGIAEEDSYPYMMADGLCHIDDTKEIAPIKSWANVESRNIGALKHALLTQGPISVGLDASHRSL